MRGTWTAVRGTVLGATVALLAAMVAAPVSAGSTDLQLTDVLLGNSCIVGKPSGSGPAIEVELRSSTNALKSSATISSPSASPTEICFAERVRAGDHIVVLGGRDVAVPPLQIKSIDRDGDVVAVRGDPGMAVQVRVHRCALGAGFNVDFCPQKLARNVTLDGTGKRNVDLTQAIDLRSHDLIQIRHAPGNGDLFRLAAPVPGLFIEVGDSLLDGVLPRGINGTYQLRTASGTVRATATLIGGDDVLGTAWTKNGDPVAPKVGNRITGNPPANLLITIPKGPTQVLPASDVIKGTCFKGGKVMIEHMVNDDVVIATKADGTFSVDLTAKGGFEAAYEGEVTCVTKQFDLLIYRVVAP